MRNYWLWVGTLWMATTIPGVWSTEDDDDAADDDSDADDNDNSLATEIERWVPAMLGALVFFAVFGWCASNLYRASRLTEEEQMDQLPKIHTKDQLAPAAIHQAGTVPRALRDGAVTGDVSPEYSAAEAGIAARQQSLRGSMPFGSIRSGSVRDIRDGVVGGEGVLLKPGEGGTIGVETFEGGEVQGKKAPGETGDVYRNPLARTAGAGEKDRGPERLSSKNFASEVGSDAGSRTNSRATKPTSSNHHGDETSSRGSVSPPKLRPGVAQSRRNLGRSRNTSFRASAGNMV